MIEVLCRDGSYDDSQLEDLCDLIAATTGETAFPISQNASRAMVFWTIEDVQTLIEDDAISGLKHWGSDDMAKALSCAEGRIHQAMLAAGWDALNTYLIEAEDAVMTGNPIPNE